MFDFYFKRVFVACQELWCEVVVLVVRYGIFVFVFGSALFYFDGY